MLVKHIEQGKYNFLLLLYGRNIMNFNFRIYFLIYLMKIRY